MLANPRNTAATHPRAPIAPLVWALTVLAWALGLSLAVMPFFVLPTFRAMFHEFGGVLPLPTRVVLSPAFSLAMAGLSIGFGVSAVLATRRTARVALAVAALTVGLIGFAMLFVGLYWPIFTLAGSIQSP